MQIKLLFYKTELLHSYLVSIQALSILQRTKGSIHEVRNDCFIK